MPGQRISDMPLIDAAELSEDAVFPVVSDDSNYKMPAADIFDGFADRPTSAELAAADGAERIGYKNPLGGPAVLRLLRSRLGETVSALDYCVGSGTANDHEPITDLIGLQPAEIVYPPGCWIGSPQQIVLFGDMDHRFHNNSGIITEVDGYGVVGLGYPTQSTMTVAATMARDAMSVAFTGTIDLAAGDDFYFYDTATQEYDMDTVRKISGGVLYFRYGTSRAYSTPGNVLIYKLANACRNVRMSGPGEIRNVSTSLNARALRFANATDVTVDGLSFAQTGGGCGFENTLRFQALNVTAEGTKGVGLGGRNAKGGRVLNYTARNTQVDESLTFYKNSRGIFVSGVYIEQYLNGEAPAGNQGAAGNCVLVDDYCSDIMFSNMLLRGSATYSFFVTNNSHRINVDKFNITLADLGGIRFGPGCNDCFAGHGRIANITRATDSEQAGTPATAAIQDETGSTGNVLEGGHQTFANIAGGINVRRRGTPPARAPYGAQAAAQADTVAADLAALKTDYNALLAKLRAAKVLAT